MKRIIFLLLLPVSIAAIAQTKKPQPRSTTDQVVTDVSLKAVKQLSVPSGPAPSFPSSTPDSLKCGALWNKTTTGHADTMKRYDCFSEVWVAVGAGATYKFDRNFHLVSDSAHLADSIRIKAALLLGINTIPAWDPGYKVLNMAGNVGLRSQVGGHNLSMFTNLYNIDGSSTWYYAANGYGSNLYQDEGGGINFYSVPSGTAGGTVTITKPIWSVTRNGATLTTMRDTSAIDSVVGYKHGELMKVPFTGGGGGGGNTIYIANDSLTSDRLVRFISHELKFGDPVNLTAYININPKQTFPNINAYVTDLGMNTFSSVSINRGAAQLQHSDNANGRQGSFTASEAIDPDIPDTTEYAVMNVISGGNSNGITMDSKGAMVVSNPIAGTGLKYNDSSSYANLDTLGLPPLGLVRKQVPTKRHVIFTPADGDTIDLVNNQYNIIHASDDIATLTANLPSSPINGDCIYIKSVNNITTFALANGTIPGGNDTSFGGQNVYVLVYDADDNAWY